MSKTSIGTWICSYNLTYLEILTKSDFKWFTIDLEHSGLTLENCLNIVTFIKSSSKKKCYVRMGNLDKSRIRRVLDFGVDGVILPMVKNKDDLSNIIDASFYPPIGTRGTGIFRAHEHGNNFSSYIDNSYNETRIFLQIEHIEAIENLNVFLESDRVYGLIIGPYDLSASLGDPGNFSSNKFLNALNKFEELALTSQKEIGYHLAFPDKNRLKELINLGYSFIGYSTDILLFNDRLKSINKEIKSFV